MSPENSQLMMESILETVKKSLGPGEGYDYFDPELIMYINSELAVLTQIGVGPPDGFSITGPDEKWSDFIADDFKKFQMVQSYLCIQVKLQFDPPLTASVLDSLTRKATELQWRLFEQADPKLIIPKSTREEES